MKIFGAVFLILLLLLGAVLSLPFLIDLNRYQEYYAPLIEEALNRKVQLRDIRLTIWPRLGARVGGMTVLDDPAFSSDPFISLGSLDVGVRLMPLLSRKIEVEELSFRDPVITVIKNKAGVTNLSTIGSTAAPSGGTSPDSPSPPEGDPLQALALLAVDRVSIGGGKIVYRDLSTAPVTEYQIQNLELELRSVHLAETPSIHLDATVQPYNLPVTLNGSFGPLAATLEVKRYDFTLGLGKIRLSVEGSLTGGTLHAVLSSPSISTADVPVALPLTKPVEIKDLRIVAKAPYPLKQGVSTMELADVTDLSFALTTGRSLLDVKGSALNGHAKVAITSPSVTTEDLPVETGLKKPTDLKNFELFADFRDREGRLSNLSFQLFNGLVKSHGGMSLGSAAPPFNGTLTIQGIQLKPLLEAVSPDSRVSMSGTAALNLAVAGRGFTMPDLIQALEGPGHLEIKEGKIEGVNLAEEAAVLKIAGISLDHAKATAFSVIETDVFIKQGTVNVQKLLMDSHDFQATGTGTVGFDQALNLAMTLNLSQALSRQLAGASPVTKLALKDGRLRVPFLITGTVQNPSYGLDTKGLTGKVQEQLQEKARETVKGLIEGTTKPEDLKQQGRDLLKELLNR